MNKSISSSSSLWSMTNNFAHTLNRHEIKCDKRPFSISDNIFKLGVQANAKADHVIIFKKQVREISH